MLHYHRLFKFLNKIKSKYLEESGEGEGEMETPPPPPAHGSPGQPQGMRLLGE